MYVCMCVYVCLFVCLLYVMYCMQHDGLKKDASRDFVPLGLQLKWQSNTCEYIYIYIWMCMASAGSVGSASGRARKLPPLPPLPPIMNVWCDLWWVIIIDYSASASVSFGERPGLIRYATRGIIRLWEAGHWILLCIEGWCERDGKPDLHQGGGRSMQSKWHRWKRQD